MTSVVPFLRVDDAEAAAGSQARLASEIESRRRFEPDLPFLVAIS